MHRILASSVAGAALLLVLLAPSAASAAGSPSPSAAGSPSPGAAGSPSPSAHAAGAPPAAFVRVEGAGATLLPQTLVQTTSAPKVEGNPCPGTDVTGALDDATGRSWSGSYSSKFHDYLVTTILGETPSGNNFWTLWVNGRSSTTGGCETVLHPGDHVLWFDCQADMNFNCTNNPLAVRAAATVQRDRRFTATVTQLDGAGHATSITGAAVSGQGIAGVSGAGGNAHLTAHRTGVITLQADKSGATPSDPVFVCVYAHRKSECGSAGAAPRVHVAGIREREQFTRTDAPREFKGTAGPDPAGLTDVSLSLLRHAPHSRCSFYDGDRGTWRATSCRHATAPLFSIGASEAWSYLLPSALPGGSYRLEVVARDGAGGKTKLATGVSKLDFSVTAGAAADRATADRATATAPRGVPTVQMMVVGHTRTLATARTIKLSAQKIRIGRRSCTVPAGTALAGLIASHRRLRVTDVAGCDPASMFVTKVGPDANHGIQGWEYKVGHKSPSTGAGDPSGRLRQGQQLLWFWCLRASACEQTLTVTLKGRSARVVGYDDNGHGKVIAGATVHLDRLTATTGADGTAKLTIVPGRHTLYASKRGLVASFPQVFTAGP
jgi:hypothetical protein